jgi:hypothetical protein
LIGFKGEFQRRLNCSDEPREKVSKVQWSESAGEDDVSITSKVVPACDDANCIKALQEILKLSTALTTQLVRAMSSCIVAVAKTLKEIEQLFCRVLRKSSMWGEKIQNVHCCFFLFQPRIFDEASWFQNIIGRAFSMFQRQVSIN